MLMTSSYMFDAVCFDSGDAGSELSREAKDVERLKRKIRHKERKIQKSAERARQRASSETAAEANPALQNRSINAVPSLAEPVKSSMAGSQHETPALMPKPESVEEPPPKQRGHTNFAAATQSALAPEPRLKHTVQLKVLVVGDTKCGKTSIIQRYAHVSPETLTRPLGIP